MESINKLVECNECERQFPIIIRAGHRMEEVCCTCGNAFWVDRTDPTPNPH